MVRHGDLELIPTKEEFYTHRSLGTGSTVLVSGHLGSSPGVTWGKGNLGLVCESLTKDAAGSVGSGQVGCVSNVSSRRSSLWSLGVSLPWALPVSSRARPQMPEQQEDRKYSQPAWCWASLPRWGLRMCLSPLSWLRPSWFTFCEGVYRVGVFFLYIKVTIAFCFLSSNHNERLLSRMYYHK